MDTRSGAHSPARSGHALVLALVVLLVTSAAASLLAAALSLEMRVARREVESIQLRALSDAAVAEALARLADTPHFEGAEPHALGAGRISSRVGRLGRLGRRVTATAVVGQRSRTVELEVRMTVAGPVVVEWRRLPSR